MAAIPIVSTGSIAPTKTLVKRSISRRRCLRTSAVVWANVPVFSPVCGRMGSFGEKTTNAPPSLDVMAWIKKDVYPVAAYSLGGRQKRTGKLPHK